MPTERIAMRKVREILRLTYDAGLPSREVARLVGVGSTGVRVMLQRCRASKLDWPLSGRADGHGARTGALWISGDPRRSARSART